MIRLEISSGYQSLMIFRDISKQRAISAIIVSILVGILYDFGNRLHILFFLISQLVTVLLIFSPLFLKKKYIILPLIFLITICPDLSYVPEDFEFYGFEVASASPWQFWFFGISPATTLLLHFFFILIRLESEIIRKNEILLLIYFIIIQFLVFIVNGNYSEPVDRIISDIKVGLYFFLGLRIFQSFFLSFPTQRTFIFQSFFALLLVRYGLDFFYLIFSINRTFISEFSRISVDSTKGILIFLIFLSIGEITKAKLRKGKIIYSALTAAFFFLLVSYQTRWLLVVFLVGLVVYFYLTGIKNTFRFLSSHFLIIALIILGISYFLPYVFEIILGRFGTILEASPEGIEQVDVTRLGSIVNSLGKLNANNGYLFGMGYGSFFTDEYFPLLALNDQDFDAASLSSGKYYRVHDFTFHFLFKYGIFGILVFTYIILQKPVSIFFNRKILKVSDSKFAYLIYAMLATTPFIITSLYWTAKGLLVITFFIAFCQYVLYELKYEATSK